MTAAGGREPERLSKRANLVEGLGLFLLIPTALWSGLVLGPDGSMAPGIPRAGQVIIGCVAVYALAVAPWVHGDGWHGIGLARPPGLFGTWARHGGTMPVGALVAAFAGLWLAVGSSWDYLLFQAGAELGWPDAYRLLRTTPWKQLATLFVAIAVGGLSVTVLIRPDNLSSALETLGGPAVAIVVAVEAVAVLMATATGDWSRFSEFTWTGPDSNAFVTRLLFYLPWAILQQWLLLGYLNTRIRKGLASLHLLGLSGRTRAAMLTGVAFGVLHVPQWPLALATALGGCAYGWLFQEDRSRNLFALGSLHALAGTLVTTTTTISLQVGP